MDNNTYYIDGVGQVHFVNGNIRIDCIEYKMVTDATGASSPKPTVNGCIVVPPQGFLSMLNAMQDLATKLVEAGVFVDNKNNKVDGVPTEVTSSENKPNS